MYHSDALDTSVSKIIAPNGVGKSSRLNPKILGIATKSGQKKYKNKDFESPYEKILNNLNKL